NLGVGQQNSLEHATVNESRSDTVAATLTSSLSNATVNVVRGNYLHYGQPYHVQSPNAEALVFQSGQQVLAVGQAIDRDLAAHRGEWSDTLSHLHGTHTFKFGGQFSLNRITSYAAANASGSYRFSSLEGFGRSLAGAPVPIAGDQYTQAFSG